MLFGCHKGTGCVELMDIDDIQLETRITFHPELTGNAPTAMRHWISLIKGDKKGKPMACSEDKEYTAKMVTTMFLATATALINQI